MEPAPVRRIVDEANSGPVTMQLDLDRLKCHTQRPLRRFSAISAVKSFFQAT